MSLSFSRSSLFREAAVGLLCLGLTLGFFQTVFYPRSATFVHSFDNTYQYYAWIYKFAQDWRSLHPPLWDFAVEAGIPFPGELQTGAFYPVGILYVWLAGTLNPAKVDFLLLLHFAGAMWGMSLFLRERGIGILGSLFAGAIFSWIGSVAARAGAQANIFVGLVYLPWILFWFQRAVRYRGKSWRNVPAALCGIALGFSLLSGHPQPFIHNGLMLALFALFLCGENYADEGLVKLRQIGVAMAIAFAFCVTISFIQVAASAEYFARAYRWVGLPEPVKALQVVPIAAYRLYNLSVTDFRSLIRPEMCKDSSTLFLTITALVCASIGLAARECRRFRWLLFSVITVSLLVALGEATWIGAAVYRIPILNRVREPIRIVYLYQFCIAAAAGIGLHFLAASFRPLSMRALTVVGIVGIFLAEAKWNSPKPAASTQTPISADQVYRPDALVQKLESEHMSDGGLSRVLAQPKEAIPPNGGDVFKFNTALGHRSSMLINYFDYISADWSVSSKSYDEIGVRLLLTETAVADLPVVFRAGNKTLYLRPTAEPIFHFVKAPMSAGHSSVGNVEWRANAVSLTAQVDQPARLIFAESAYPGWTVKVNRMKRPLGKEGPFMSVDLAAGTNIIEWRYSPWWFWPGIALWGLAGCLVTLMLLPEALLNRARRWLPSSNVIHESHNSPAPG